MKQKEVKISIVNKGKKFVPDKWTYKKHKEVMKELAKVEKGLSAEEKEIKFQNLIILKALENIDEKVTEKDLEDLHPNDRIELWFALYSAGKEGVFIKEEEDEPPRDVENFQEKKKTTKASK